MATSNCNGIPDVDFGPTHPGGLVASGDNHHRAIFPHVIGQPLLRGKARADLCHECDLDSDDWVHYSLVFNLGSGAFH